MAAKITKEDVDREINLANMSGDGPVNPARAIEARKTLLRWAEETPVMFDAEYLLISVRNAADLYRA